MKFIVFLATIAILFTSIKYGIYEFKQKNIVGGSTVLFLGFFQSIFTNCIIFLANN